jgi:lytic murein transglycosylase
MITFLNLTALPRVISAMLMAATLWCAEPVPAESLPFETWIAAFKREAQAQGISGRTLESALGKVAPDPRVLALDQSQHKIFQQSFEQFAGRMVNAARLSQGRKRLQRHAALFRRIEKQFGVPAPMLVAIWGLETDYGTTNGRFSTLRALATLAHGSKRHAMFRDELLNALRIVDRGDMAPERMRGAWAGELGQTQFMPSSYLQFALDYDGDGRSDLIHSEADALASTANYLKEKGWRRGEAWEEGSPNFDVILIWNHSRLYAKTIAHFADRLAARD